MEQTSSVKTSSKTRKGRIKRIVLAVLLLLLIFYIVLRVLPHEVYAGSSRFAKEPSGAPLVIAHGGAKHLYPENTIMAFEESYAMGADVLEVDLCLTADNVLITHHDLTVDATSSATGAVRSFSLAEITELNFGANFVSLNGDEPYKNETSPEVLQRLVPMTVEQMFTTFGTDVLYILEIKDEGQDGILAAEELNRLINEYSMQEYVCVASFHGEVIEHFRAIKHEDVNITTDYGTSFEFIALGFLGLDILLDYEYAGFQLPSNFSGVPLNNSFVSSLAQNSNMFLHYWTINDKEEMRELILLGCDGIITDRPDILIELLEEMGY